MIDQQGRDALKAMCVAMTIFSVFSYVGTAVVMQHEHSTSPFWKLMWSDGNKVVSTVHAAVLAPIGSIINGKAAHAR